ncbi:MAG: SAM-dependent methyltransferase [Desulfobacteraceae bacterium]|nr:MAG: SAM-dependent methyltransferase [Desulfobacteraceae bacterium]
MKKNRHSKTAVSAAVVRALHTAFESPVVFDDPYAGSLAGPVWQKLSGLRLCYWIGTRMIYSGLDPIRRQIVARARYAEDRLEASAASGVSQYVIIGAGFDSFALRRKDLSDGRLSVFELDHPASQQAKKARLRKLGLALPEKHEFVEIDFEKEGVGDALAHSSYSRKHPAFFSWLGTVHYLTPQAVINTLNAIAACACAGSELVLDYSGAGGLAGAADEKMEKKLKRYTARRGEPMLSTFEPQQFRQIVSQAGFHLLENVSPEEQSRRYFTLPDGKTLSMPGSYFAHLRLS